MTLVHVTAANLEATIQQGIVLLDFWAAWCGPCRAFAPVFEAAAARHPGVVFGKVDTEAEPELASAFRIRAIPTVVAMRDGVVLTSAPGALPAAALDEWIGKIRDIDMSEVHRALAAQAGAAPRAQERT